MSEFGLGKVKVSLVQISCVVTSWVSVGCGIGVDNCCIVKYVYKRIPAFIVLRPKDDNYDK